MTQLRPTQQKQREASLRRNPIPDGRSPAVIDANHPNLRQFLGGANLLGRQFADLRTYRNARRLVRQPS